MSDYTARVRASMHYEPHDVGEPYGPELRCCVEVESGEYDGTPAVGLSVLCMGEEAHVYLTPAEALRVAESLSRQARYALDPAEVDLDPHGAP